IRLRGLGRSEQHAFPRSCRGPASVARRRDPRGAPALVDVGRHPFPALAQRSRRRAMKQTLVLAVAIVSAALLVATAVVSLNAHVRALADDVAALTRQVTEIGEDVKSLADDVATMTDTMTQDDNDASDDDTCPADI